MALGFFSTEDTLTPESIERRRKLAETLMQQGMSDEPIRHWTQGLGKLAKAASGAYMDSKLNEADKANREYSNQLLASILGGAGATPAAVPSPNTPAPTPNAATPAAAPAPVPQQPLLPNRPQMPAPNIFDDVVKAMPQQTAEAPSPFGVLNSPVSPGSPAPLWTQPGLTKGLPAIGQMPASPSLALNEPGPMVPMGGNQAAPSAVAQGEKPSDNELVIRTIAAETSGKSPQEAQAIANVILNRAKSRNLTPGDVVLERNQFEPWNGGPGGRNDPMGIDPNSPRYQQAQQALAAAVRGDVTGGATHFYAPAAQAALGRAAPSWAQGPGQQIGATAFYAPEGRVTGGNIPTSPQPATPAEGAQTAQFNVPGQPPAAAAPLANDRQQAIARFLLDPRVPQSMKQSVMPVLSNMMNQQTQNVDLGDRVAMVKNGQIIGYLPKSRDAADWEMQKDADGNPTGKFNRRTGEFQPLNAGQPNQPKISRDAANREAEIRRRGLDPSDPTAQRYILTGQLPDPELKPDERKAITEAEDQNAEIQSTMDALKRAKELVPKAYSGMGAGTRGAIVANVPGAGLIADRDAALATQELKQLMSNEAIQAMSKTLKGATTDREMAQFMSILGDPASDPQLKIRTIDRMMALSQRQQQLAQERIKGIRGKTYFSPQRPAGDQPAPEGYKTPKPEAPTFEEMKEIGGKKYGRRGSDWFEVQ